MHQSVRLRESARRQGKRGFVWKYGILGFGLPWAVATAALSFGLDHGWAAAGFTSKVFLLRLALYVIVMLPLAGLIWGRVFWSAAGGDDGRGESQQDTSRPAP